MKTLKEFLFEASMLSVPAELRPLIQNPSFIKAMFNKELKKAQNIGFSVLKDHNKVNKAMDFVKGLSK